MIFHPLRRAFTLTELLVVIAIIAILAAMLLPAIGLVRTSARTTKCASNQHQINLSLNTWANDHEGRLPPGGKVWDMTWAEPIDLTTGKPFTDRSLLVDEGFLPPAAFVCPEAAAHRAQILETALVPLTFDYAANLCFVGTTPDPADSKYGWLPAAGGHEASRFPGTIPPTKTVLTIDRVMFVDYTDTDSVAGQLHLTTTLNHGNGTLSVASYADGHVAAVHPRITGGSAVWPVAEGTVPSYAVFWDGVQAGE